MSFTNKEVKKATAFYNACFHLSDRFDDTDGDFNATLIGLIKGTAEIIKEQSPETYMTICEALTILENK